MRELVPSAEENLRVEGLGEAENSMRTRSRGPSSVLSVMHAGLPYLGRGGQGLHMERVWDEVPSASLLHLRFDPARDDGGDALGRHRIGAASGVATKHLYGRPSGTLAIFGSGK